jgi:predicted transcriptional regulator
VLTLSENEQRVIEQLLALSLEDEVRIEDAAAEIAGRTDLTAATVKRLLYELAQFGVLERREVPVGAQITGQKPSGVALNFSAGLFTAIGDG